MAKYCFIRLFCNSEKVDSSTTLNHTSLIARSLHQYSMMMSHLITQCTDEGWALCLMHLSTASPGGTTPGHTKGKEGNIGELQTEFPPGYRGNKQVCFAFLGGEGGGFLMS